MAIEKREINGQIVGFNTKTNSFCNLPDDFEEANDDGYRENQLAELFVELSTKPVEELIEYAKKNSIDIGQATSPTGILNKIKEHYEA